MKILLQQIGTGWFLTKRGAWAPGANDAWEFQSPASAIKYCVTTGAADVQFVLRFRQMGEPVDLPLDDASFAVQQVPSLPWGRRGLATANRREFATN